jgi:hypothetical protein
MLRGDRCRPPHRLRQCSNQEHKAVATARADECAARTAAGIGAHDSQPGQTNQIWSKQLGRRMQAGWQINMPVRRQTHLCRCV